LKPGFAWIALAALAGSLLLTGDATASCTSKSDATSCVPLCACCRASAPATPVPNAAALPMARPPIPVQDQRACREAPGCGCWLQAPVAPEPKGQRASERRPNPKCRRDAAGCLPLRDICRPLDAPTVPSLNAPHQSPLYLRISRLLI